jgi:hypothetical protein
MSKSTDKQTPKPNIPGTRHPDNQPSSLAGNQFENPVTLKFDAILPITSMLGMEIPPNLKTRENNDKDSSLSCDLLPFLEKLTVAENQQKWIAHMVKIGILPRDFDFYQLVDKLIEYQPNSRCIYSEQRLSKENMKLTLLISKLGQPSLPTWREKFNSVLAEMRLKMKQPSSSATWREKYSAVLAKLRSKLRFRRNRLPSSANLKVVYKDVLTQMLYTQRLRRNLQALSRDKKDVVDAKAFMKKQRPILCKLVVAFMDLFKKELPKSQRNAKTSFMKVDSDNSKTSQSMKRKKKKVVSSSATVQVSALPEPVESDEKSEIEVEAEVEETVSPVIDPIEVIQRANGPEKMLALILAVLTKDERSDGEDFDVLELLENLDCCRNSTETLFTFEHLFKVTMAFWKTHIQESKKMDSLFVSPDEVDSHMLKFLQTWAKYDFPKTPNIFVIKRLFDDVMCGIALLSACSPTPDLVNASLALFFQILEKIDCFDTGVDDEFFQMVAQFLGFPKNPQVMYEAKRSLQLALDAFEKAKTNLSESTLQETLKSLQLEVNSARIKLKLAEETANHCDMRPVQAMIELIKGSFENLCYRAGLSNERDNILSFLASMCSKNLSGFFIILRTFIGSGKTASLAGFLESTICNGETAVFMTPCPSEVLNFLKGIFSQIKELVRSDVFKALSAKDPFRVRFQTMFDHLSTIDVFVSHLQFGQTLVAEKTNIFVLEPTPENIISLYGTSAVVKTVILDDVPHSAEIAKTVFSINSKCTVIVSGADVGQFEPSDFTKCIVEELDIQKRIGIYSLWETAKADQEAAIWKVFNREMKRSSTSMSFSGLRDFLRKIGISVLDIQVSEGDVSSIDKMKQFVKDIAVNPIKALEILDSWYIKATLPELTDVVCQGGTIIYDSGHVSKRIQNALSMLSVCDENPVSARSNGLFDRKECEESGEGGDGKEGKEGEEGASVMLPNPQHRVHKPKLDNLSKKPNKGQKVKHIVSTPTFSQNEDPDAGGKSERKERSSRVDPFLSSDSCAEKLGNSKELPTRQATIDDIRLERPITRKPGKNPSSADLTIFKREVAKLQLSDLDKKALIVLFEQGIGLISQLFPINFNKTIIEFFRKSHLAILDTNYPCESLNLGAVSKVIVVSPISGCDFRQTVGRSKRPNSEPFQEMIKDCVLKVLTFEKDFIETSATGAETDLICYGFISLSNIGTTLRISHICKEFLRVLRVSLTQYSTFFPEKFQVRLESCISACFVRLFHLDLRVSNKCVLIRDCACVLSQMVTRGFLDDSQKRDATVMLKKEFGITGSPNLVNFFQFAGDLVPKLSAKTISDLRFGDTIDSAIDAIKELRDCLAVVKSALAVCSLVVSNKDIFSGVNAIQTLLLGTAEHISLLLTLLNTRLTTMHKTEERLRPKFGNIVSQKVKQVAPDVAPVVAPVVVPDAEVGPVVAPVVPDAEVVPVAPVVPDAEVVPVVPAAPEAQVAPVCEAIFDDPSSDSDSEEEAPVGLPAMDPLERLLLKALGYVEPDMLAKQVVPVAPDEQVVPAKQVVPDEQVEQVAPDAQVVPDKQVSPDEQRALLLQKIVLSMRTTTVKFIQKTYMLLQTLMELPAKDDFVVLGVPKGLSKNAFLFVEELTAMYHELCILLINSGFMLEVYHEEASDGKISSVSFEALKVAVHKHDAQAEHKLISDISKEANDALLAEIEARLSALN